MSADAGVALWRALARSAPPVDLDWIESRPWSSATFTGERHRLRFAAADDDGLARWLATVAERDLPVAGHLLADLSVAAVSRAGGRAAVTLEALTLMQG